VPALGLDGLSSAAYGPEAAMTILLPLGALGLAYIGPITLVILILLGILYFSYRQTIVAYPNGGGSYTVARENLGVNAGLLAAAALMLDYVLNVAVGISAGVGALVSAVPQLLPHTLALCLAMLIVIAIVNLRGAREAGLVFALPTYLFVGTLLAVIVIGLWRLVASGGHPAAIVPPPPVPAMTAGSLGQLAFIWILLRSFASGCTAMTGVEAVSNGVSAFAAPAVKRAQQTLTAIVVLLAMLLAGVAVLSRVFGIDAMDEEATGYQSVISQLIAAVAGHGVFYYITIASVLTVLALSANTSYAGFPRLCRLLALDDYLPHAFALLGRRLVYAVGVMFLTVAAGLLLIAFGGITDRLIPLFAVGAFLAFTMSQAGMVMHWRKHAENASSRARLALTVNAVGAVSTGVALLVILAAKFIEGAWITLLVIPALMALFVAVKRSYGSASGQIFCGHAPDLSNIESPIVVVPMEKWNLVAERALRFAFRLSSDLFVVHVDVQEDGTQLPSDSGPPCPPGESDADPGLKWEWETVIAPAIGAAGLHAPVFTVIPSPYRRLIPPILDYVRSLREQYPTRVIAVIVPELVQKRWWEFLLHNHRAAALKAALLLDRNLRVVVVNVPWYLDTAADSSVPLPASTVR
jgi:amino acid transporter